MIGSSHGAPAYAAARTFEGVATSHCESWSKESEKGEAAKCRRRATVPSAKPVMCRLKSQTVHEETGEYLCQFSKPGWFQDDFKMIMEPGYHCPKTIKC